MRKGKPNILVIISAIMFGAALAVMIAALVCMAADVYIWHTLVPPAILLSVVTGLIFVVSLALHFYNIKTAKPDPAAQDEPHKLDKRGQIARGIGIAAFVCFYIALFCVVISKLCSGLADAIVKLLSAFAALASFVSAVVSVILSKRSNAEKLGLFSLLSIYLAFVIVCIVFVAIFAGIMFYMMLVSWAQWGLL